MASICIIIAFFWGISKPIIHSICCTSHCTQMSGLACQTSFPLVAPCCPRPHLVLQEDYPHWGIWVYFENFFLGASDHELDIALKLMCQIPLQHPDQTGLFFFELIIKLNHFGSSFFCNDQCSGRHNWERTGRYTNCSRDISKQKSMKNTGTSFNHA